MANRIRGFNPQAFRRSVVTKRQSLWLANLESSNTIATSSTATLVGSLNAAALALRPFTIVRTRGYLFTFSDQVVSSEFQSFGYGHIVVTDQAVAAGIGSIPTPISESASDFHVYERLQNNFTLLDSTGFGAIGASKVVESKAMRKVDLGEDLAIVLETSAQSNGVTMISFARVLIKLH